MSETTADGTVETPNIDWEARAKKAEAKIVDMKKTPEDQAEVEEATEVTKVAEVANSNLTRDDLDKYYEERTFFESNPDLSEHKEQLNKYVDTGLSFKQAKVLLEQADPTINNRKTTKQSNFTAGDTPKDVQVFTTEQLGDPNLSQKDYNRAMELVDSGKAKLRD